jgi:hypothetical protein
VRSGRRGFHRPLYISGLTGLLSRLELWRADITYIRLRDEFVFLAVVLDAYSRRVIGWALDRTLKYEEVLRKSTGAWPKRALRSASSWKRSTTRSGCTRLSAIWRQPTSSKNSTRTTRTPLRGKFLYEFSKASGNLSSDVGLSVAKFGGDYGCHPHPSVSMSFQPAIPWRVALQQGPPPLTSRSPVCGAVVLPVEDFSASGQQCLNYLCQPRGQAQFDTATTKLLRGLYERAVTHACIIKNPEKVMRFIRFARIQD